MPSRAWFSTFIYHEPLRRRGLESFNRELTAECNQLREYDAAGRRWSAKHYRGGYTSYASLNRLHQFSSTFAKLEGWLDAHVRRFSAQLDLDLRGRRIHLTDLWVNIMPEHTAHGLHLHPLSFISGTYYVATPRGSPGLKFEDPRLSRFMAAPPRKSPARPANQIYVTYPARAGDVILFESWLRHEVAANPTTAERISVSFNYNWT
ncbi:MAG: hypothetical protein JNG83_00490 [Opitutaceae bacterium]|nr:hypothetical protein [Opitutaceae bacterium]